jgi:hypothetical protein
MMTAARPGLEAIAEAGDGIQDSPGTSTKNPPVDAARKRSHISPPLPFLAYLVSHSDFPVI